MLCGAFDALPAITLSYPVEGKHADGAAAATPPAPTSTRPASCSHTAITESRS